MVAESEEFLHGAFDAFFDGGEHLCGVVFVPAKRRLVTCVVDERFGDRMKALPRLGIDLLEFMLMLCNWVAVRVKDYETGAAGAMVDCANEGRHGE